MTEAQKIFNLIIEAYFEGESVGTSCGNQTNKEVQRRLEKYEMKLNKILGF